MDIVHMVTSSRLCVAAVVVSGTACCAFGLLAAARRVPGGGRTLDPQRPATASEQPYCHRKEIRMESEE